MEHAYSSIMTAYKGRYGGDDDDDLVQELVQATDVDKVIERIEMDHYQRLSPILQSMSFFKSFSRQEGRYPTVVKQQQQHRRQGSCAKRLFTPLRSPVREEEEESHRQEHEKRKEAPSLQKPTVITSPPPLDMQQHEQKPRRQERVAVGMPPPSSYKLPHVSDEETSSAPHENEHTERPSVHQRNCAQPIRMGKFRPPVESPCPDNLQLPLPTQKREIYYERQRHRRNHNARHAPFFGEPTNHNVSRLSDLQNSYRELSDIRASSAEGNLRQSQSARLSEPHDRRHRSAYWRSLTPPPLDNSSAWRRSSSPPVVAPSWSIPVEGSAWTQHSDPDSRYNQEDYWGCINGEFEDTSTATTEEANTQNGVEFDEDEGGNYIAVPPRIIEREQHRRSRVVESPNTSNAPDESIKGQTNIVEEKSPTVKQGLLHALLPGTHDVPSQSTLRLPTKSFGSNSNICLVSEHEYLSTARCLSPPYKEPQGHTLSAKAEQWNEIESSSQPGNCSQTKGETRRLGIFSPSDDTTLRPNSSPRGRRLRRTGHSTSQLRQQAPTDVSKSLYTKKGQKKKDADLKKNKKNEAKCSEIKRKNRKVKKEHDTFGANENEKNTRIVLSSCSGETSSSYSYYYSSYSGSSDNSLGMQTSPFPEATSTYGTALKLGDSVAKSKVKPKIMPLKNSTGNLPVQDQKCTNFRPQIFTHHGALQREQRKGPPPPEQVTAPQVQFFPSSKVIRAETPSMYNSQLGSASFFNASRSSLRNIQQSKGSFSLSSVPSERNMNNDKRFVESVRPYVSYLPRSALASRESLGLKPRRTGGRQPAESAGEPNVFTRTQKERKEIVWRTGDSDSVTVKSDKARLVLQTVPRIKYDPPQQRSASVGIRPPPPRNLPMRVRRSMSQMQSASASRMVEVPYERPSRESSLLPGQEANRSEGVSPTGSVYPPKPSGQLKPTQKFAIDILQRPKPANAVKPHSARMEGHLVQIF